MKLANSFVIPSDPDHVFDILLDLEKVAVCMPGASLAERDGNEYKGSLKLRVGPITAAYAGTVTFTEVDRESRQAVLHAVGSEVNGQGSAEARITAQVQEDGDASRVAIDSDVAIRGRAAQFGRGALGDVTQRILDQFARNLEESLMAGSDGPATAETAAPAPEAGHGSAEPGAAAQRPPSAPSKAPPASPADESLDVMSVVVMPMLRRWAGVIAAFLAGALLGRAYGRRIGQTRLQGSSTHPRPNWPTGEEFAAFPHRLPAELKDVGSRPR